MSKFRFLRSKVHKGSERLQRAHAPQSQNMSILDHIRALRRHIISYVMWFALLCVIAIIFMDEIIAFLRKPFVSYMAAHAKPETQLMATGVFEVVTMNFKICLLVAFVASIPFMLREIWKFVAPALYENEKKIARPVIFASVIMFFAGVAFGFFVIVPAFLDNTLEWASQYANVVLTVENYFDSISVMVAIFGCVFEVPVILSLLGLAGIIRSEHIAKNRRIVILVTFIVAAILSPPDVISQTIVAIPLYAMCELSVFALKLIEKNKKANSQSESD